MAARVFASGLVVRDVPATLSNWRATSDIRATLADKGVVAMADIDTRRLTRILREKGAQNACLVAAGEDARIDEEAALAEARGFAGLQGMDLAKEVSTRSPYEWREGTWRLAGGSSSKPPPSTPLPRSASSPAECATFPPTTWAWVSGSTSVGSTAC